MMFFFKIYHFLKISVLQAAYCMMYLIPNFKWKSKDAHNNILVFRSAALGDFIMSLPALKLLREYYPNHRIVLLTIQSASRKQREKVATYTGATNILPWLDLAYPQLIDDAIVMDSLNPIVLWRDLRPNVRKLKPKHCFILAEYTAPGLGLMKKIALLRFLGVSCPIFGWRVGNSYSRMRRTQYENGLFRHHVFGPIRSVLESPITANIDKIKIEFDICIPIAAKKRAVEIWEKHSLNKKKVIAIAPGAVQFHKRWPIDKFVKLCVLLLEDENLSIIVIGTANDILLGTQLSKINPVRIVNIAGETSVMESAAILQHCALLVGNDGGAMHLGDSVGCPVVSIVPGLEYPISIEPWHNIPHAVRYPVPCAPCYNFIKCPNGHNRCMIEISVSDVLKKIIHILSRSNVVKSPNNIFKIQRKNNEIIFCNIHTSVHS